MKIINSSVIKKPHWPWPFMDINEVADCAANNKIYMAKLGFFEIEDFDNWDGDLHEASNSKMLWINSLVSVHACLEVSSIESNRFYYEVGLELLKKYLSQYDRPVGVFKSAWTDEHAVSNRLYVLTALIHDSITRHSHLISQLELLFHAERHAEWLHDDSHYVENNHGVMMDLALLQFSFLIENIEVEVSKKYRKKSLKRLSMMLSNTFLPDGYCTENSPSYHFVNYGLFSAVQSFFEKYGVKYDRELWSSTLLTAKDVGRIVLRSNGTLPLIGDSASYPKAFFKGSGGAKEGVGYFPNSGLFIVNKKDFQFTLRAGGARFSHRHIDDLSLTLWWRGKDFIVDPGLYNYDGSDKIRREFVSFSSHSGLYLKGHPRVIYKNYKSPKDLSHFRFARGEINSFFVGATSYIFSKVEVERDIEFRNGKLVIVDSFASYNDEDWFLQYVLHPDVEVELLPKDERFVLLSGGDRITVDFNVYGSLFDISVEDCFFSETFMELRKTKKILLSGRSKKLTLESVFLFE